MVPQIYDIYFIIITSNCQAKTPIDFSCRRGWNHKILLFDDKKFLSGAN